MQWPNLLLLQRRVPGGFHEESGVVLVAEVRDARTTGPSTPRWVPRVAGTPATRVFPMPTRARVCHC
jgi:hypothetical protein